MNKYASYFTFLNQKNSLPGIAILVIPLVALTSYWIGKPTPRIYETGYDVPLNVLYSLALAIYVLLICGGLGNRILKIFRALEWSQAERIVVGTMLGLGTFAYVIFACGLAGWLSPTHFVLILLIASLLALPESLKIIHAVPGTLQHLFRTWKALRVDRKILAALGMIILVFALLITLTPPFDYDSLAYHLQGPRLFLDAGRIQPNFENWFTLFPFTWEMIYMLGLGLGSDIFAKLIHFATLLLFLLSAFALGRRLFSAAVGWIATAILMGIPILIMWGTTAYTDLAWALFQFLAISLVAVWQKEGKAGYLFLAGMMQGWAMGCKYPAVAAGAAIGVIVLFISYKMNTGLSPWKRLLTAGLIFGGSALMVASPWYLKNLLWTGDPAFPLLVPPTQIDPLRVELWKEYLNSFGVGKQWYHYLLLPIHIFTQYQKFGTYMGTIDMPSPLFFLILTYPWARKKLSAESKPTSDLFVVIGTIIFAIWAASSQQTRFLLPVYPVWAILCGVCSKWLHSFDLTFPMRKSIIFAFVGATVFETIFLVTISYLQLFPLKVQVGIEPYSAFTSRMLNDYNALAFINETSDAENRALLLWDGRGYYCKNCIADVDQNIWIYYSQIYTPKEIIAHLKNIHVRYLIEVNNDRDFFTNGHDPHYNHITSIKNIEYLAKLACASVSYIDTKARIFDLGKCFIENEK